MRTSESTAELDAALAKAQGEFPKVIKDSDNPFFKSKYADLATLINTVQDVLGKNGLSIRQHLETEITEIVTFLCVTTRLSHLSGQFEESTLKMPLVDIKPQTVGSCSTYCRRYALQSVLRLAGEDDDGNAASARDTTYAAEQAADKREKLAQKRIAEEKQKLQEQLEASLAAKKGDSAFISEDQRKRLFGIGRSRKLSEAEIREAVGACGYEHTSEIPKEQYEAIIDFIDPDFEYHEKKAPKTRKSA
jgi:hypothetical protein